MGWRQIAWVMILGLSAEFLACSSSHPDDRPQPKNSPRGMAGTLTVSSLGIPYGATLRCRHPSLPEPLVGYFHEYRDGMLILNSGVVPYDSTTQVQQIDNPGSEKPVCDTLDRSAQWSVLQEGQWVTLFGLNGQSVARGRVDLVLPDTLFVDSRHISQDSICRIEIAWREDAEYRQGWWVIPATMGKTVIKVVGIAPMMLWSLVTDDSQPLRRWVNW